MKKSCLSARAIFCASLLVPGLAVAQGAETAKEAKDSKAAMAVTPGTAATTGTTAITPMEPPATLLPAVTDPGAAVPPVVYQSVFAGTPTGVEMESADWKKANAEVGQFKRGHVDILKWDEAQNKPSLQVKPMAAEAAKPAMPPTPPSVPAAQQPPRPTPAPQAPSVHKH